MISALMAVNTHERIFMMWFSGSNHLEDVLFQRGAEPVLHGTLTTGCGRAAPALSQHEVSHSGKWNGQRGPRPAPARREAILRVRCGEREPLHGPRRTGRVTFGARLALVTDRANLPPGMHGPVGRHRAANLAMPAALNVGGLSRPRRRSVSDVTDDVGGCTWRPIDRRYSIASPRGARRGVFTLIRGGTAQEALPDRRSLMQLLSQIGTGIFGA
jgi:hypothetical protein